MTPNDSRDDGRKAGCSRSSAGVSTEIAAVLQRAAEEKDGEKLVQPAEQPRDRHEGDANHPVGS